MDMNEQLTRQQRRIKERIENEAKNVHLNLCQKFLAFFLDNNPNGPEILEMKKELSAKWKVFCFSRNLNKDAVKLVDDYCDNVIMQYNKNRDGDSKA